MNMYMYIYINTYMCIWIYMTYYNQACSLQMERQPKACPEARSCHQTGPTTPKTISEVQDLGEPGGVISAELK